MPTPNLTAKRLAGDLLAISIAGAGLSDDQRTTCALAAQILGGQGPWPPLHTLRARLHQVLQRIQHEIEMSTLTGLTRQSDGTTASASNDPAISRSAVHQALQQPAGHAASGGAHQPESE